MNNFENVINLFEKLANNAHHRVNLKDAVSDQIDDVQQALIQKNQDLLKSKINGSAYLADTCKVVAL